MQSSDTILLYTFERTAIFNFYLAKIIANVNSLAEGTLILIFSASETCLNLYRKICKTGRIIILGSQMHCIATQQWLLEAQGRVQLGTILR